MNWFFADKSRHDKLVVLVDKLLCLMPKLRTATLAAEKATLARRLWSGRLLVP